MKCKDVGFCTGPFDAVKSTATVKSSCVLHVTDESMQTVTHPPAMNSRKECCRWMVALITLMTPEFTYFLPFFASFFSLINCKGTSLGKSQYRTGRVTSPRETKFATVVLQDPMKS